MQPTKSFFLSRRRRDKVGEFSPPIKVLVGSRKKSVCSAPRYSEKKFNKINDAQRKMSFQRVLEALRDVLTVDKTLQSDNLGKDR